MTELGTPGLHVTHGTPVGRLAPSPTGRLHLGHARSFLVAWWHVRQRGGRIVLRLEDLDGVRTQPQMIDQTLHDLEWLGLDWDGSPELQSRNTERIWVAAERLLANGSAYACVCSRSDLRSALSAPHASDREQRYPGTCRGRFTSIADAEQRTGQLAGVRFRVPEGTVEVVDGFASTVHLDVAAEVGDFLIARRDKIPAYQLAVVVDDAAQGVTEVLRGDDLRSSTARQWHLQAALGLPHPSWYHVPLVCDAAGQRLAKRSDAVSLANLREQGTDARAIVAWVAESAGMTTPDRISAAEAIPAFSLERMPRTRVLISTSDLKKLGTAR